MPTVSKNLPALFNLIEPIKPEEVSTLSRAITSLETAVNNFRKGIKELDSTGNEFKKTSSDFSGGGGDKASVEESNYLKYVKTSQYAAIFDSFMGAVSNTTNTLVTMAVKAQDFNVALTNLSYRMINPGQQMRELYDEGKLVDMVTKMNNDTGKPWQGIQLSEAVMGTEMFYQYGKTRNITTGDQGIANLKESLEAGKLGARARGLDFGAALETSLQYNAIGVPLEDLKKFNLELGAMARLGAMSSREILTIDKSIRNLAYTFNMGGKEIQRFGIEYMTVAAKLSLAGGNPIDMLNKMNQYQTGSESGMLNALILGYKHDQPEYNLRATQEKAKEVQAQLATVPPEMRAWMLQSGLGAAQGLSGFDLKDLEVLARTGKATEKADPNKLLEEISKNTGVAVTSADKTAGALNLLHMGQVRLGQGLLNGFNKIFDNYGKNALKYYENFTKYFGEHSLGFAALVGGLNSIGTILLTYFTFKGGASLLGKLGLGGAAGATAAGGGASIGAGAATLVGATYGAIAGAVASTAMAGVEIWARSGEGGLNEKRVLAEAQIEKYKKEAQRVVQDKGMSESVRKWKLTHLGNAIKASMGNAGDNLYESLDPISVVGRTLDPRGLKGWVTGENRSSMPNMPFSQTFNPSIKGVTNTFGLADLSEDKEFIDGGYGTNPLEHNARLRDQLEQKLLTNISGLKGGSKNVWASGEARKGAHGDNRAEDFYGSIDGMIEAARLARKLGAGDSFVEYDPTWSQEKALSIFGEKFQENPELFRKGLSKDNARGGAAWRGLHTHVQFGENLQSLLSDEELENLTPEERFAAQAEKGSNAKFTVSNQEIKTGTSISNDGMTLTAGGQPSRLPGAVSPTGKPAITQTGSAAEAATDKNVAETSKIINVYDSRVEAAVKELGTLFHNFIQKPNKQGIDFTRYDWKQQELAGQRL